MPDIGISYDASTAPSPIHAQFSIGFAGNTLRATLRSVQNFAITLKPTGNIAEVGVSAVAWPIAQTLGATLPTLARSLFDGYSFDVATIDTASQNVEGETIKIGLGDLTMSNHNGMLLVKGTVNIA